MYAASDAHDYTVPILVQGCWVRGHFGAYALLAQLEIGSLLQIT